MNLDKVTRIEIIGPGGRMFRLLELEPGIVLHLQDDERTLKLFVGENAQ